MAIGMTSTLPAHIIDLLPGQPYPSATTYQGLLYPGEVLFSEQWDSSWGAVLRGHEFFRIVFLGTHQQVPPEDIQDSRIAVCVPSTGGRREQERKRERLVIRDVRSRYGLPSPDTSLLEEERQTYTSGTILTHGGIDKGLKTSLQSPLPSDWVSSLSLSLLAWTYPQLPIAVTRSPRSLGTEEAHLIFQGLIQQKTDPEVIAATAAFGPGLGLSTDADPGTFDPSDCPMFQILRSELAEHGGSLECAYLYERLGHVHGLPHPLVTLCVLAFLHYQRTPTELHLKPEHRLQTATGGLYSGQVVLPETVANLEFTPSLEVAATTLRYAAPVSWNTLAHYFGSLDPSLQPTEEPDSLDQQSSLMTVLANLREEARITQSSLHWLARALDGELPRKTVELLERLGTLGEARAPETALRAAQRTFGTPAGLERAVEEYRRVSGLVSMQDTLIDLSAYLVDAAVPEAPVDLDLKRQQLVALLNVPELIANTPCEATLSMLSAGFLSDYRAAYIKHHDSYNQVMASLVTDLRDIRMEAGALRRLNGIRELGGPVEEDAPDQWRRLSERLAVCPLPSDELPLDSQPTCPSCGLLLGTAAPSHEVGDAVRTLKVALREQNSRLSLRVISRILDGHRDERIDLFIKVVQTSDLSGLANVLDDQVERFLRELLAQP